MRKPLCVLTLTILCGLALGGVALAEGTVAAEAQPATPLVACNTATLDFGGFQSAVATARKGGGGIPDPSESGCCQSDPCPATGNPVSCCSDGVCQGGSTWVYCQETGRIDCPACSCQQGASCFDDSDCDCNLGYGECDKEFWEVEGSCLCYF